jgi:molybdate transport system regulatory protein
MCRVNAAPTRQTPKGGNDNIWKKVKKPMKLRSFQMLFNEDGDIIMGKGRMDILTSIEETGSINKTAKALNMSYKSVWSKIRSTGANFGRPVVHADRATGTKLTEAGQDLLNRYRKLTQQCRAADDQIFERVFPAPPEPPA